MLVELVEVEVELSFCAFFVGSVVVSFLGGEGCWFVLGVVRR